MTDVQTIGEIDAQVHQGIAELRERRRGKALFSLWRALDRSEEIESPEKRSEQLRKLAVFFEDAGIPDLQIMALEDAADLDSQSNDEPRAGGAFLDLGRAHMLIGNYAAGERCSRTALERLLACEQYGSAAAASTNLALMLAKAGRVEAAIELLGNSLEYLQREDSPDTEMRTRVLLIHYVDQVEADPGLAVDAGKPLQERFGDAIWGDAEQMWRSALERSIERYLGRHPEIDEDAWRRRTFGWLGAAPETSAGDEEEGQT